ncbi:MAG: SMP-30/gluconolactonase/LRE family protein [Pseudonocardiaceae bacterium]
MVEHHGRSCPPRAETAPVHSCTGWNLGQPLRHLGGGHRWADTIVRTRATQPRPTNSSAAGWVMAGNEIVVDGRGNIYVNSVGFRFGEEEFRPGIIALITPDGAVCQVADDIAFPNGMVVTPDNSTLIIAESWASKLTAFDIAADGSSSPAPVGC